MPELTPERLAELRRVAEAATPGPWRISDDGPADRFVIASADREHIAETTQGGSFTNEDLANARHISTFDPPTVLAMLDEIERLRRERETLAAAVRADDKLIRMMDMHNDDRDLYCCSIDLCDRTIEAWRDAHFKRRAALALLDGSKGGDGA